MCLAGDAAIGVPAAALLREVVRRGEIECAEAALDFFFALNTVPLAARPPELGPPLFLAVVHDLLPLLRFPEGFTSWDDSEVDEARAPLHSCTPSQLARVPARVSMARGSV